jgi:dedicator of cytokinesis protein 3
MPGWRPLPRIAFAICTYPFQPSSGADLPLEIGDELYIIEQGGKDGAWYRGYLVAPPSLLAGLTSIKGQTLEARVFSGIFPKCCVEVREILGDGRASTIRNSDQQSQLGRSASSASTREPKANGMITPDDSSSVKSPNGQTIAKLPIRTSSRQEPIPSQPPTRRKSQRKRASSQISRWDRTEHLQQLALPLSPISPTAPRDALSPRPPAPVPMLKIGDESATSTQEPLVDEIASCLREWHSTKLHELLLTRKYNTLDKMSTLVNKLDAARRQLLHKVLTAQELRSLREQTVWDLVSGNKLLSTDVIVRSPSERGRILTADDSAIEVTRLQSLMSMLDKKPVTPPDEHTLHHLLVNIRTVMGSGTTTTTQISMYLCIKRPGEPAVPLSEVYSIDLSAREGGTTTIPADKMKVLFVDISSTDIGEGSGSGTELFIVFKAFANEPYRGATVGSPATNTPRESTSSPNSPPIQSNMGSLKGTRRSMMFGSKNKREAEAGHDRMMDRPTSHGSGRGKSSDGRPDSGSANPSKNAKRTIAMGVCRVDQLMRAKMEAEQEVFLWRPENPLDEPNTEGRGWHSLIEELYPAASTAYRKLASIRRLVAFVKPFENLEADALVQKTPTLLHNITQTRKIGFSGAPTRPRSDIYLTLIEPWLPRNACLSHPKMGTVPLQNTTTMSNLQLTIEVRRSTGERIDSCIYPSCNSAGHTAWRTTAVERGESWNLTVRLAIPPEDVPGCHIVMSVADAPGFPFALCWMPLWTQDAFVRDGEHSLALYRYDEYTSSMISGKGAYMALPWSNGKKDETVTGPLAALRLRTFLCSTKYSQDPNLLGLLKWKDNNTSNLTDVLRRFTFVPEIEIVKLLNEVFDALFEILVEYAGSDEYEDLVFNALITVLGIVHDRRFKLGPLVDQYAETRFQYPFATSCLTRSFTRLLENPTETQKSRTLRSTIKVGSHIFKFIMNAREQQKAKEAGIGITTRQPNFTKDLQAIFKSLGALMVNPAPVLVGTKTLLVQHFHTWLPELHISFSSEQILQIASDFVIACQHVTGKLLLYKLVFIRHLCDLEILKIPDTRQKLLRSTVKWLAPCWGRTEAVTEQWKDQVRLCCSIVAAQVDELGNEACEYIPKLVDSYVAIQFSPRGEKTTLSLLFPSAYPFPSRPATTNATMDEALTEIAALLAAMSNLPTIIHLDAPKEEITDFLQNALQVYISILDGEAFPKSWLSVRIYHHRSTMRTLEKIYSVLVDSFLPHPDEADQFNTELWRSFFDALLKLVGSDALALETFPEQKRRAVWKIAGDVRELGADLLQRSWEAIGWETSADDRKQYDLEKMGGYQVQYVPSLVAPIVELCLSVHEGLRSVAIEVLQTMIISEWTLSEDLSIIQAEMIECLDRLFKTKHLTESILQKLFIRELIDLFEPLAQNPEDPLFVAVKNLISTIDELLDLLVAVHSTEATGEIFHIMDTLHLMEFLRDVQKEDIYIKYVHQLAQLQADASNFTEAGLALRLHAELYEWDPTTPVEPLEDPPFPGQTSFERKESLYFQMIKNFEDGQSWENALSTYLELATQYEHNIFDFAKLARTQRAMATIYESISKGERQNLRYFRVVYKGLGWPVGLRDKHFIFEGSATDKLATFTDHMQQQHPSAQIVTSVSDEDVEGQFLMIYAVSPQKDITHPIYQRAKVAQPIRDYYLLSRPNNFTTTSRKQPSEAGVREATVEKIVYTTAEQFPTILRRSEIISVGSITLTPLQTAIERTTRKTAELFAFEKRAADGEEQAFTQMTDVLTSAVDATSDGSIAAYRDLLPKPRDSQLSDEEEEELILDPLENALKVAMTDHALAIKRCLALYTRSAHQATKAELSQRK